METITRIWEQWIVDGDGLYIRWQKGFEASKLDLPKKFAQNSNKIHHIQLSLKHGLSAWIRNLFQVVLSQWLCFESIRNTFHALPMLLNIDQVVVECCDTGLPNSPSCKVILIVSLRVVSIVASSVCTLPTPWQGKNIFHHWYPGEISGPIFGSILNRYQIWSFVAQVYASVLLVIDYCSCW